MKLTIGIATRGRPELARWAAETTAKNCLGDTQVVVLCDGDDQSMEGFEASGVIVDRQERPDSVASKWNRMTKFPADIYLAMCDHRTQATPGFDLNIMEASEVFPDGIGCVYQHLANLSFPIYQAPTAKMVEIMGHVYVEHFPYWFVDHWLDDVCKMTGRYVFAEGNSALRPRPDGGTQDFREPGLWGSLYDALYTEREEIAERLFSEMDEPEWKKDQLRMNFPLVHQRSRIINDLVRNMQGNASPDPRYMRIREAGVRKIERAYNQLKEAA